METIRRELEGKIVRKKIAGVEVRGKKIVKTDLKEFEKILAGNQFTKIDRRGKLLIFHLLRPGLNRFLLAHLKMTGQLIYRYDHKTTSGEPFGTELTAEVVTRTIAGGHNLPKDLGLLPNKFTHLIFSFF